MKEGLFIVIYGINNLGKSTQAEMLVDSLTKAGLTAEYIKYPIYDLKPTGPKINEILRGGHKQMISEIKFQTLYAQNRLDFQAHLCKKIHPAKRIMQPRHTRYHLLHPALILYRKKMILGKEKIFKTTKNIYLNS